MALKYTSMTTEDWLRHWVYSAANSNRNAKAWMRRGMLGRVAANVLSARTVMLQAGREWRSLNRVEVW